MRFPMTAFILGTALLAGTAASGVAQPVQSAGEVLSGAQAAAIEGLIHDYIRNHPEIIIQSLQAEKQRLEEEDRQAARAKVAEGHRELIADPDAPVGGNPAGDVTIVEFFDYQCPYCKQVEPQIRALLKADPKLRIVYKEYPILGPASVFATRVALAARRQGKYQLFHDAMLATKGHVDDATILRIARLAGLDMDRLRTDMKNPAIDAIVQRNVALAQELKLSGTPGFVIGRDIVDGAASAETLQKYVEKARAKPG